jgi:hypothetical protein
VRGFEVLRSFCIVALAVATGCELEGRTLGTQLAPGRDISSPNIVWSGSRPFVSFDQVPERLLRLYAVPFDGTGPAVAVGGAFSWSTWTSPSGYLVAGGYPITVFDLESASVVRSVIGSLDQLQGDTMLFGRYDPLDYFLAQVPDGDEQQVGDISQSWFAPSGRLYFSLVGGAFGAIDEPGATPNMSGRLVQDFLISPDERVAVVRDLQDSQSNRLDSTVYRVLELPSFRELMTLPLRNRYCSDCDWLGFSPDGRQFFYAENFPQESGLVDQYEVETNQVLPVETRPGPYASELLWSPTGGLGLLGELPCVTGQDGCRALYRSTLRTGPVVEPISTGVAGAKFSADGNYLLFEDALNGGRLLVASTGSLSPDPSASAAVLSPPGSLVDGSTFDPATGTAVFWARPEGGKSSVKFVAFAERANLYAAPPPEFRVRRLAEAADTVAVGRGLAVAIVRFSPQDLTGDLVLYDLRSGQQRTLAAPVSSFWATPACPSPGSPPLGTKWQPSRGSGPTSSAEIVAPPGCADDAPLLVTFTVRGRVKSEKDGLWALTVQP